MKCLLSSNDPHGGPEATQPGDRWILSTRDTEGARSNNVAHSSSFYRSQADNICFTQGWLKIGSPTNAQKIRLGWIYSRVIPRVRPPS